MLKIFQPMELNSTCDVTESNEMLRESISKVTRTHVNAVPNRSHVTLISLQSWKVNDLFPNVTRVTWKTQSSGPIAMRFIISKLAKRASIDVSVATASLRIFSLNNAWYSDVQQAAPVAVFFILVYCYKLTGYYVHDTSTGGTLFVYGIVLRLTSVSRLLREEAIILTFTLSIRMAGDNS